MSPATKDRVREAVADMQQPGASITLSAGGASATIEDPREICLEIAKSVETDWFHSDKPLEKWPQDDEGKPVEFQNAELVESIAIELIRRIIRFDFLRDFEIGFVYRNKDPWESKGRTVLGEMKKPSGLLKFYGNHDFELQVNWLIWAKATPWQKVALVYHELRHGAVATGNKPAIVGHHFEGFFDEIELFGTNTYQDWARLAKATTAGESVDVQYHIGFDD